MSDFDSPPQKFNTLNCAGMRLDKALSVLMPEHTRSTIQQWIRLSLVRVDGQIVPQKHKLSGTEILEVQVPDPEPNLWSPTEMDLSIVHEDDEILVLDKPPGLVVHPGAGTENDTLLNGLIHYIPELANLARAGIVHRLDKNTSGLMVVSKTERSRQSLIQQLDCRSMKREYIAVSNGVMISGETINQPIGRSSKNRLLMCVTNSGKPATTHIRVLEKFRCHCVLQANLETGRTHQIRVHLSWKGYPIVGDPQYSKHSIIPPSSDEELINQIQQFPRQALHARKLTLNHPRSGSETTWISELPGDMVSLVDALRKDQKNFNQRPN